MKRYAKLAAVIAVPIFLTFLSPVYSQSQQDTINMCRDIARQGLDSFESCMWLMTTPDMSNPNPYSPSSSNSNSYGGMSRQQCLDHWERIIERNIQTRGSPGVTAIVEQQRCINLPQ